MKPPKFLIWHSAFYSMLIQSPGFVTRTRRQSDGATCVNRTLRMRKAADQLLCERVSSRSRVSDHSFPFYSLGIELETDTAGYRACHLIYYCRRSSHDQLPRNPEIEQLGIKQNTDCSKRRLFTYHCHSGSEHCRGKRHQLSVADGLVGQKVIRTSLSEHKKVLLNSIAPAAHRALPEPEVYRF